MRRWLHNVFSYTFICLFAIALIWAYVAPFVYERILNPFFSVSRSAIAVF